MKVLIVEPNKPCRAQEIPDTLEAMQAIVGGYLRAVYPFRDEVALVCNEEGRRLDLPYNRPLTNDLRDLLPGGAGRRGFCLFDRGSDPAVQVAV